MLKKKIEFHNMDHSTPLEQHANQKLEKINDLLKKDEVPTPQFLEVWLKALGQHPHHSVEIHLKTPQFDLNAHDEGNDLYVVLDNVIDKVISLLKKHKEKNIDKQRKAKNEKRAFIEDDDKYTLS
ncbi:ribosome-associated translation inhibitor RaiA [Candidatus Babeliales bacterium]|nr:ribosome-associated translation inhibitor RaiA [Candidatus Babeliales bacterium]